MMTDAAGREPALELDEAWGRIRQLEEERRALSEQAGQGERELRSAKADIAVKEEYIASLEAQLEKALALVPVLDAKTAYIESLPSVRLKMWLKGMRRRSSA